MKFSELKPGNIFRYAGDIYMKTKTVYETRGYSEISNATKLKDGEVSWFNGDTDVTPVQQWTYNFTVKYKED